jgi:hypothetical protein
MSPLESSIFHSGLTTGGLFDFFRSWGAWFSIKNQWFFHPGMLQGNLYDRYLSPACCRSWMPAPPVTVRVLAMLEIYFVSVNYVFVSIKLMCVCVKLLKI